MLSFVDLNRQATMVYNRNDADFHNYIEIDNSLIRVIAQ